jgi:hypothetical protein
MAFFRFPRQAGIGAGFQGFKEKGEIQPGSAAFPQSTHFTIIDCKSKTLEYKPAFQGMKALAVKW